MSRYIAKIDAEIARLKQRIADLEAARRVLPSMLEGPAMIEAVAATTAHMPRKKIMRDLAAPARARKRIMEFLRTSDQVNISEIRMMLAPHNVTDSTMWRVLKDMRDNGVVNWDNETRLYSITKKEKAAS